MVGKAQGALSLVGFCLKHVVISGTERINQTNVVLVTKRGLCWAARTVPGLFCWASAAPADCVSTNASSPGSGGDLSDLKCLS